VVKGDTVVVIWYGGDYYVEINGRDRFTADFDKVKEILSGKGPEEADRSSNTGPCLDDAYQAGHWVW
jgi:hypothetical protein